MDPRCQTNVGHKRIPGYVIEEETMVAWCAPTGLRAVLGRGAAGPIDAAIVRIASGVRGVEIASIF